ncbi:MAG TPA: DivIVA domain-containing protein [Pilimelia sp.]|nr:DivIVA domain-containing protein [Pilimelia sp.]
MGQYVLLLVVALTVGAVVFGVTVLMSGGDPGLSAVEPDGRSSPLPGTRPLGEADVAGVRFDTVLRGYRMAQVDQALDRAAYDIGYKDELISVLEAEVAALREGRTADAEVLRRAREAAVNQPRVNLQAAAGGTIELGDVADPARDPARPDRVAGSPTVDAAAGPPATDGAPTAGAAPDREKSAEDEVAPDAAASAGRPAEAAPGAPRVANPTTGLATTDGAAQKATDVAGTGEDNGLRSATAERR